MNETNNATSLATASIKHSAPLTIRPAADLDSADNLARSKKLSKNLKVATAEVKDVKKDEKKEEVKSFPKPPEAPKT